MARKLATLILPAVYLLTTAMAGAQGYPPSNQPRVNNPGNGNTVKVFAKPLRSTVTLGGTVVPHKEVTLSAQLPGRIKFLAGREGDQFDENSVLAELDDSELRAQHQAAWAALRDADAAIRNAGWQYSRELIAPGKSSPSTMPGMGMPSMFDQMFTRPMSSMMGYGAPGYERQADLYSRGTQVETARNSHIRAQSQLRQLESKFRDAQSIAPFNGVIVKKLVEVGDTVQPGQPMLQFADVQYLQIQVDVPARLMPGIRKGMIAGAKLDVRNTPVNVRVAQIFPMADPQRHTVTVKLDVPPGAPAAPGMYAEVMIPDINAPARTVLVIPSSAIIQRGSLPMVEVAREGGAKELRIVRKGEYLDRNHVTILSGLKDSDYVYLQQGQRMRNPGPPPATQRGTGR